METNGNSKVDRRNSTVDKKLPKLPYGEIYRIIDKLNDCTYIGQHKFLKTDYTDGGLGWRKYMSSSTIIKRLASESEDGYARFIKQHVEWCWSSSELADEEARLIKLEKQEGHGEYNIASIRCDYAVIRQHKLDGMTTCGVLFRSADEAGRVAAMISKHGMEMISAYKDNKTMTVKRLVSIYHADGINDRSLSMAYAGWLRENGVAIRRGRSSGSHNEIAHKQQDDGKSISSESKAVCGSGGLASAGGVDSGLSIALQSRIAAFSVGTGRFEYDADGIPLHSRKPGVESIFRKIKPDELAGRYLSGESAASLSREYGVKCVNTMITALRIAGVETRDLSAAVREDWRDKKKTTTRKVKCPVCGRVSVRRWDRLTCGDKRCASKLVNAPEFRKAYAEALAAREEWKKENSTC